MTTEMFVAYTSLGKVHFTSNMFERAVQYYEECLSYEVDCLDAPTYQAQSLFILGKYEEPWRDYRRVLEKDVDRIFTDAVRCLVKMPMAKEDAVEGEWGFLVELPGQKLPGQEELHRMAVDSNQAQAIAKHCADGPKKMHYAPLAYYDVTKKDVARIWNYLSLGNRNKLSTLPPFDAAIKVD